MRASLPMYNLPEMQADNAAFWAAMRTELRREGVSDVPEALEFVRKPVPERIEPDTLFTQVCGWPLQTIFAGQGHILGVPVYDAPYCCGPRHTGVFIVRADATYAMLADLRGTRFVFNSLHSNSGMNLPRRAIADIAGGRRFFASCIETHSAPANLDRVAAGEADATSVDCVTFAFFARHRPNAAGKLRVLAATPSTPALPFITAAGTSPEITKALRAALTRVARAPEWAAVRSALMLADIVPSDALDYGEQRRMELEAAFQGYPELC